MTLPCGGASSNQRSAVRYLQRMTPHTLPCEHATPSAPALADASMGATPVARVRAGPGAQTEDEEAKR